MSIKINPLKNVSNTNVLRGDGSNPLYDLLRVHPDQAGAVRDTHLPVLVADEAHHVRHTGGAELRLYRTAGHLGRRVLEVCRTVQVLYCTVLYWTVQVTHLERSGRCQQSAAWQSSGGSVTF